MMHAKASQNRAAILLLALSVFAISTAEMLPMGLLLEIGQDYQVSIKTAGLVVSVYALGVVIGGPLLTVWTAKVPRKALLISLLGLFLGGSLLSALAPTYGALLAGRAISAVAQGAFFGVGVVFASQLAQPGREGATIALVASGLTLATVLGGPLGTLLGQYAGWRAPFFAIALITLISMAGIYRLVPRVSLQEVPKFSEQVRVILRPQVLLALSTTVFSFAGVFLVLTYIAPLLEGITQLPTSAISPILLFFGLGTAIGNFLGGRLADKRLHATIFWFLVADTIIMMTFAFTSHFAVPAVITLFLWGLSSFALVTPSNIRVLQHSEGAQDLASSLNIVAFNLGNAGGAFIGGYVVESVYGLQGLPVAAALMAVIGIALLLWGLAWERRASCGKSNPQSG